MAWKRLGRSGVQIDTYYRFKLPDDENPKVKLLEKGMELVGRFMAKTVRETADGTFTDYVFEGTDGKVFALGQTYALAQDLEGCEAGSLVKIEYHGKDKKKGGRSFHNFVTSIDDGSGDGSPDEPL